MKRKENLKISKVLGDKSRVFCHADYAQSLYNLMVGSNPMSKDNKNGDILRVTNMRTTSTGNVEVVCENYDSFFINVKRDRPYLEMLGFESDNFAEWINDHQHDGKIIDQLTEHSMFVAIENVDARKASLLAAHSKNIVNEFKSQISNPTTAYMAKVIGKNQGGFIVEVQGMKAFLPGSLAAANKLIDFESFIGRSINVMIEDFLTTSNMFVVSYKKYLDFILPDMISKLEKGSLLTGTITGTSKFGIFVEFEDIFTGLLHTLEMTPEVKEKFDSGFYRSGNKIEAWLKDVRDNRLILTNLDPAEKQAELMQYKEKTEGNVKVATVVSVKQFGILLEIDKGVLGLLPIKETKKLRNRVNVGDTLTVCVNKIDASTGKIFLTLTEDQFSYVPTSK